MFQWSCLLLLFLLPLCAEEQPYRILHLTFHQGCAKELADVAHSLGLSIETWWIPSLPPGSFDGTSSNNFLYNITHERAERIWQLHQETFKQFDLICVSDTAPLARIFLQHHDEKPLLIWICNRFDYSDQASLDGEFPDAEYYQLFQEARQMPNVKMVAYTPFEQHYARSKGIEIGNRLITPSAPIPSSKIDSPSIPSHIAKEESFFLPPYHNETLFMNLAERCTKLGIPAYCGRYGGPSDLCDFKGIIHLPYAWSNLALFENLALGIPYFLPSKRFFQELTTQDGYFHHDPALLLNENLFDLSEWYAPDRKEIFIYFDSWDDLVEKIATTNYAAQRQKILAFAQQHRETMLARWRALFQEMLQPSYVVGELMGQLGNQMFQVAATTSLALDHGAVALFPGFLTEKNWNTPLNYERLFSHLNVSSPPSPPDFHYLEPQFSYSPIPYHPHMAIRGWFQSDKYFRHHQKEIIELFSPPPAVMDYLNRRYPDLINHPSSVAIHYRSYDQEDPSHEVYAAMDLNYYKEAMALFPEESLFVVFSNDQEWCKRQFAEINRSFYFVEREWPDYHDFYLMSLCKHNIICNSTFSWWAAYLNRHPEKLVVAPSRWFQPGYGADDRDLIPESWIKIP